MDNIIEDVWIFDIEKQSIDYLMSKEKNKKLVLKVYKKMLKQIEKEPMKNWFEININDYSPKQMNIIKRYFCDWSGFGFSKVIPRNEMFKEKISMNYCTTVTTSQTIVNADSYYSTESKVPIERFYITWFNEK